jgi:hypothetical protein
MINLKDDPQTGGCYISLEPAIEHEIEHEIEEFTRLPRSRRQAIVKASGYFPEDPERPEDPDEG